MTSIGREDSVPRHAGAMSTSAMPDTEHVTLHLAFRDRPGSLSAIAACLGEHGINIVHVSAFCTTTSIAIDTVEVNTFTPAAAESIKSRIQELNAKAAPEPATGGAKRDEQGLKDSDSTSVADDEKLGSISPAKAWLAGETELVSDHYRRLKGLYGHHRTAAHAAHPHGGSVAPETQEVSVSPSPSLCA